MVVGRAILKCEFKYQDGTGHKVSLEELQRKGFTSMNPEDGIEGLYARTSRETFHSKDEHGALEIPVARSELYRQESSQWVKIVTLV